MSDLREAIAKWLFEATFHDPWKDKNTHTEQDEQVCRANADQLLALLREHGLVELDKDQSLPENPYASELRLGYDSATEWNNVRTRCIKDMLKAGFKKVKEIA